MINVAILSSIRRWHLRDQVSIREIARRTGLSRITIKKYLFSGIVEPAYPERISPGKLDGYRELLANWLQVESRKSRKQKRSSKQLYQDLLPLGFEGSYDRVAAFARRWRQSQHELAKTAGKGVYIPLSFAPGEAFQFDWSEDWAVIAGVRTKLQVAHFKLSYSRAFYLRAYPLQTHEMLFDAHQHAFTVFDGITQRGIYDNMKTAVDKVRRGKLRDVNARFAAMASHYLFSAEFCNPAAGWEKGQIEKNVQDARHRIWHQLPRFKSLADLNIWLEERCIALWSEIAHPQQTDQTIAAMVEIERSSLMPVPQAFDGCVEHTKRVSPTCLITFERNRYSVPASYANRPVSLRVYCDHLVFAAEGNVIATHERIITSNHGDPGRTIYDWRHYLSVLQRKPGALHNGAPFTELPKGFKDLQLILLKQVGGDREMVQVLALVLQHDEMAVLAAVELALESGAPTKQHVLNILTRLLDPAPLTPTINPSPLQLTIEPQSNMDRYDRLREVRHAA